MAEDRFDIEEFLEENESKIQDYDSFKELIREDMIPVVPGRFNFTGLAARELGVSTEYTKEEQWEIIKSVIISQGNVEAFQEYFNELTDEDAFDKLGQLVGFGLNEEIITAMEIAAPIEKNRFISFVNNITPYKFFLP